MIDTNNYMRLEGGQAEGEGDILIRAENGLISTICGSTWDLTAANVTCKQLGYEHGAFAFTRFSTHLSYVSRHAYSYSYGSCNGSEAKIQDCELLHDISLCERINMANGVVCKGKILHTYTERGIKLFASVFLSNFSVIKGT